eukprot:maker-scaffold1406_size42870-snap-gene-0.10 protein:Tk07892 transcript:maker-scaffold1406_size42870-snap-gene-0.10-mRNA-1 annotation:"AGAP007146-PA"
MSSVKLVSLLSRCPQVLRGRVWTRQPLPLLSSVRSWANEVKPAPENPSKSGADFMKEMDKVYKPDNLDKWILVYFGDGKYKKVSEVPDRLQQQDMDRAKSSFRIKLSTLAIVSTLVVCFIIILKDKSSHETMGQTNRRRHEEYKQKLAIESEKAQ